MEKHLLCPNNKRDCDGLMMCVGPQYGTAAMGAVQKQRCLACGFTRDTDTSSLRAAFMRDP